MPLFIAPLMTIVMLIGVVFVFIWEMFRGRKGVFKCGASATVAKVFKCDFRLELMHLSLILNIKLRFIHLHRFLVASATAIGHRNHFFCLHQLINILYLNWNSDRLLIVTKGFLKLPNLLTPADFSGLCVHLGDVPWEGRVSLNLLLLLLLNSN